MLRRSPAVTRPALAAVVWALVFAGVHIAWAAGSRIGIADPAAADAAFAEPWFQAYNLGVATGSLLAAGAAIALARGRPGDARSWARAVTWAAGGLLLARGLLGLGQWLTVVLDTTQDEPLVVWAADGYMLLGGAVFAVVAVRDRHARRKAGAGY